MSRHDNPNRPRGGSQQEGYSQTTRQQGWNESSRQPQGDYGRDEQSRDFAFGSGNSGNDWRREQQNQRSDSPWNTGSDQERYGRYGQGSGQGGQYERDWNDSSSYGSRQGYGNDRGRYGYGQGSGQGGDYGQYGMRDDQRYGGNQGGNQGGYGGGYGRDERSSGRGWGGAGYEGPGGYGGGYGYGQRDQDRYGQDRYGQGRSGYGGYGSQEQFDPDYSQWRQEQMSTLDNDYRDWRQDRFKKFSDEFSTWRSGRTQAGSSDTGSGNKTNKDNK